LCSGKTSLNKLETKQNKQFYFLDSAKYFNIRNFITSYSFKGKSTAAPPPKHSAKNVYRRQRGKAQCILDFGTTWKSMVSFTLQPL